MIYTKLPYNSVLNAMNYHNEVLTIEFKKDKGIIQERKYNANQELSYRLFYCKTATDCLKVFNEIKEKCTVINVINK